MDLQRRIIPNVFCGYVRPAIRLQRGTSHNLHVNISKIKKLQLSHYKIVFVALKKNLSYGSSVVLLSS